MRETCRRANGLERILLVVLFGLSALNNSSSTTFTALLASAAKDERETPERAEKHAAVKESRPEEVQMRELKGEGRVSRWHAGGAMKTAEGGHASDRLTGWGRTKGDPPRLEILRELDKGERCMVGHEARMPGQRHCLVEDTPEVPFGHAPAPARDTLHWSETMGSPASTLRSAPRILQRAGKDLDGIAAQLARVRRSFTHAQESVARARTWIEQAIKVARPRPPCLRR